MKKLIDLFLCLDWSGRVTVIYLLSLFCIGLLFLVERLGWLS